MEIYKPITDSTMIDSLGNFLYEVHDIMGGKAPISTRIITYRYSTTYFNEQTTNNYIFEYEYQYGKDLWAYYSFIINETNEKMLIRSFYMTPSDRSLSSMFDFTFKNKPIINYFWFILTLLVPLFIVFTIVFIAITPLRRKWLWIIFSLLGARA